MIHSKSVRPHILVIDDDAVMRETLVDALTQRGYIAASVNTAEAAEERVEMSEPMVVLCDLCMPEVDGIEMTRRIKAVNPGTQVIIMTAFPAPESVEEAAEYGADGYLLKPFRSIQSVIDSIEQARQHIWDWKETMRQVIKREFPREYEIIFSGGYEVPCEEELALLLAQAKDRDTDIIRR